MPTLVPWFIHSYFMLMKLQLRHAFCPSKGYSKGINIEMAEMAFAYTFPGHF